MSANGRVAIASHTLAWMELNRRLGTEIVTSEQIAESVNTNPVVIRRSLGELRKGGLVESRRGTGAGWSLSRDAESITLLDVYQAVHTGPLLGLHSSPPNQDCPVGFGIQPALERVYDGLEEVVSDRLARTTVSDLLADILAQQNREGAPGIAHLTAAAES
ncbi:Rrf2 family transcriptional regulator [Streptomyces sp. NPDC059863]|uniref:Rrf2 family transcriptional regulator n=1 Tax=unclassified Streptomyces TaxID=2593676 RepID=UPI00364C8317